MSVFPDINEYSRDPLGYSQRARAPYRQPMQEEQADSVGQKILDAGKGGISQLLGVLEKPSRAAKGLLAGKLSEVPAILPFSDTLGITDPENKVTGPQLN